MAGAARYDGSMLKEYACALILSVCLGCGGADPKTAETEPLDRASACDAIADWQSERIPMPSDWAPDLPRGYELIRFAPGMYQADAKDYFSYVFALMWERQPTLDQEQLTDIVEQYYRGLVRAVADAKKLDIPAEDVAVSVTGKAPEFRVLVTMYDPFVTAERITLSMDVTAGISCVQVKASPKPREHPVWRQLARAAACLPCP